MLKTEVCGMGKLSLRKKSNKNTTSMQLTFVTYGTITWLLPSKLKKPLNYKLKTATNSQRGQHRERTLKKWMY